MSCQLHSVNSAFLLTNIRSDLIQGLKTNGERKQITNFHHSRVCKLDSPVTALPTLL